MDRSVGIIENNLPQCTYNVPPLHPQCTHTVEEKMQGTQNAAENPQCTHKVAENPQCTHNVPIKCNKPKIYPQYTQNVPQGT